MNILVLKGSPRKGNTMSAINAFIDGLNNKNNIEVVETYDLDIGPCKACGYCQCTKGCVAKDDTNEIVDKIVNADMVIFATPVYWWGISAQLKLVLDKCFCKASLMKNKKIGVIAVGGDDPESTEFKLIKQQFECIADYLNWEILFSKSYYAYEKNDLEKNEAALKELFTLAQNL